MFRGLFRKNKQIFLEKTLIKIQLITEESAKILHSNDDLVIIQMKYMEQDVSITFNNYFKNDYVNINSNSYIGVIRHSGIILFDSIKDVYKYLKITKTSKVIDADS